MKTILITLLAIGSIFFLGSCAAPVVRGTYYTSPYYGTQYYGDYETPHYNSGVRVYNNQTSTKHYRKKVVKRSDDDSRKHKKVRKHKNPDQD